MAIEKARSIRLEMDRGKVVAVAEGNALEWATGSIESMLCKHGAVSDIIYDWIGLTNHTPGSFAAKKIIMHMVGRGLMREDTVRMLVLKVLRSTPRYNVLMQRLMQMSWRYYVLMQWSVRLLEECRRTRPDLHAQLTNDVAIGFARWTSELSD